MADDQVEIGVALGALAIAGEEEEAPAGGEERAIRADGGRVQAGGQEEAREQRVQPQLFGHARRRAAAVASGGPSGTIRLEINNSLRKDSWIFQKDSPTIEVGEMPWGMAVTAVGETLRDVATIRYSVFLADGDYRVHSVDVSAEFKLINHEDDANTITKWSRDTIKDDKWAMEVWENNELNAFLRHKKGFVKDDKITVQVEFWLSNIRGFRTISPPLDFTDPNEPSHDIVFLTDDGRKVYAGKQHLSIYSPVFNTMFYGSFVERNMKEIHLGDIDCEEFIELLKVIYPSSKKITGKNFEYLLKLGLRFDMMILMDKIEQYLLKGDKDEEKEEAAETKLNEVEKLLLAYRYNLFKLQDHCINVLSDATCELLKDSPEFEHLPKHLKDVLLTRRQLPYPPQ